MERENAERRGSISDDGSRRGSISETREQVWKPYSKLEPFTEDMEPVDFMEWKKKALAYLGHTKSSNKRVTASEALQALTDCCDATTLRNAGIEDNGKTTVEDMMDKLQDVIYSVYTSARRKRMFWFAKREDNMDGVQYFDRMKALATVSEPAKMTEDEAIKYKVLIDLPSDALETEKHNRLLRGDEEISLVE